MKYPLGQPLSELIAPNCEQRLYFGRWVTTAKSRASKKGQKFDLTEPYLTSMYREQRGRCAVSQLEMETDPVKIGVRKPFSASVDRIDNSKGYEKDNVRLVCLIVNIARSDFGDHALFKMCEAIAAFGES